MFDTNPLFYAKFFNLHILPFWMEYLPFDTNNILSYELSFHNYSSNASIINFTFLFAE